MHNIKKPSQFINQDHINNEFEAAKMETMLMSNDQSPDKETSRIQKVHKVGFYKVAINANSKQTININSGDLPP